MATRCRHNWRQVVAIGEHDAEKVGSTSQAVAGAAGNYGIRLDARRGVGERSENVAFGQARRRPEYGAHVVGADGAEGLVETSRVGPHLFVFGRPASTV